MKPILALLLAVALVGCVKSEYQRGYDSGYEDGKTVMENRCRLMVDQKELEMLRNAQ